MLDLLIFVNRLIKGPWLYAAALVIALLLGWLVSAFFRTARFKRAAFIGVAVFIFLVLGVGTALLKQWWCCSHPWGPPLDYELIPAALPSDYTQYWGRVAVVFGAGAGLAALLIIALLVFVVVTLRKILVAMEGVSRPINNYVLNYSTRTPPPEEAQSIFADMRAMADL